MTARSGSADPAATDPAAVHPAGGTDADAAPDPAGVTRSARGSRQRLAEPAPLDADSVAERDEAAEEDAREDAPDPFGEGPDDM